MFNSFSSLIDTISKLGLQISSVLQYMTIVIHKILEKGTVEYSIVHTAILEYFTIADKVIALYPLLCNVYFTCPHLWTKYSVYHIVTYVCFGRPQPWTLFVNLSPFLLKEH